MIQLYLDLRKVVYEEFPVIGRPKPKHHFLTHYPSAIRNFGPPSSFWTARYESKHRVSKSTTEAAKNFINITHTVSNRQQLRMCSIYYNGMFEVNYFKLPIKVKTKVDLLDSDIDQKLKPFVSLAGDLLCVEIEYKCRKYKMGDIVVINRDVGLVKAILVRKSEVLSQEHLFICNAIADDFVSVRINNLKDTYPL